MPDPSRIPKLPFEISQSLVVARGSTWRRESTLRILCGVDRSVRLLLLTRLPYQVDRSNFPVTGTFASMSVGGVRNQIMFKMDVSANDADDRSFFVRNRFTDKFYPETLISAPLSERQISQVAQSLEPSVRVIIGVIETGTFMKGTETGTVLAQFAEACTTADVNVTPQRM
ncbi:MAG: hypothetical protein KAG89_00215 [Fulvimarina manganoxydans]|uniref:hypothetical protein n=1 Tax=Fulvimarina manganoxydans TaxID=937218 RepID=UPI0023554984|nr:hypothetical protein [Fulvimarina manganoxydans]MCK5930570.1 hypothetical protein [Fulvimarina manganoxydans]